MSTASVIEEVTHSRSPNVARRPADDLRREASSSADRPRTRRAPRSAPTVARCRSWCRPRLSSSRAHDAAPVRRACSVKTRGHDRQCHAAVRLARAGAGPPRRSTGSRTAPLGSAHFRYRLVGARRPTRRTVSPSLALRPRSCARPARRSRAARRRCTLRPRTLRPKPASDAERAAEVDLEALDLLAVAVEHELALQADVGDLDAGAGVGAAVDVDRSAARSKSGSRRSSSSIRSGGPRPWSRRSRACRTRCRCRPWSRGGTCSGRPAGPSASSSATSDVDPVGRARPG